MQRFRDFLKRKDNEISLRRYGIDALGAMAQGLFCSLLIGTILNTLGQQFHIGFLNAIIFTLGKGEAAVGYTIGGCASLMVGPAMAVAIGHALHAPAMVLFSHVPVGFATNAMGGAGGPLAVLVTAVVAAEFGKAVSKETKVDILVTPIVTILVGIGLAMLVAAPIGKGASWVGNIIMWASSSRSSWASSCRSSWASRSRCRSRRRPSARRSRSRGLRAARPWPAAARTWWALPC